MNYAYLASNLRLLRAAAGLTQAQLAERADLTQPQISQLERGWQPRQIDRVLLHLAHSLGIQADLLTRHPCWILRPDVADEYERWHLKSTWPEASCDLVSEARDA